MTWDNAKRRRENKNTKMEMIREKAGDEIIRQERRQEQSIANGKRGEQEREPV
jgi:hypothetical protein